MSGPHTGCLIQQVDRETLIHWARAMETGIYYYGGVTEHGSRIYSATHGPVTLVAVIGPEEDVPPLVREWLVYPPAA